MKERMNDTYYIGYEGQPEISFFFESPTEKNILKMWIGYFEMLLDLMTQYAPSDEDILHVYCAHEGWYDESPWEIQNIDAAIRLFESFDLNKASGEQLEQVKNIVPDIPGVAHQITAFLEKAITNGCKVYIEYD